MTYRNDPYDPKQAALLDQGALDDAVAAADRASAGGGAPDALAALKPQPLGARPRVPLARREIGSLPPAGKADAGKRVNLARVAIQGAFDARLAVVTAEREERVLVEEAVDVTLPAARRPGGAQHPVNKMRERVGGLFVSLGYEAAEGREVEWEWYTFDSLNTRPDPAARSMMDTSIVQAGAPRPMTQTSSESRSAAAGDSPTVLR